MFEGIQAISVSEIESEEKRYSEEIKEKIIENKEASLSTRGWNISNELGFPVSLTTCNGEYIILFEKAGVQKIIVIDGECDREITKADLLHEKGLKYKVVLDSMSYYYNLLGGRRDKEPTSSPVLILGQFERVGSTWLMDMMDDLGRGHTEPFRQHIALSSSIFTSRSLEESVSKENFLTTEKDKPFLATWLKNFIASQYVPETQISKETNMLGGVGFYLDCLPDEVKVIYLKRDIRGILSSFKKRSLYERWDYENRFVHVKESLCQREGLHRSLFDNCDEEDWIDRLVTLYMVNNVEIAIHLSKNAKNVKEISYEQGVLDREDQEKEVLSFLNVSSDRQVDILGKGIRMSIVGDVDQDFDTRKVKSDPMDWIHILSLEEEKRIVEKVRKKIQLLRIYLEKSVVDGIERGVFFDNKFGVAKGINVESKSLKKLELVFSKETRESIVRKQGFIDLKLEGGYTFSVGSTLVTNSEYVAFLNEVDRLGFSNILGDNYLFYNEFIHPERGGRIVKDNHIFKIVKGFEKHPVNWVTWSGATAYAKWVGADLLSGEQWDATMQMTGNDEKNITNTNHAISDTTPVDYYLPNSLGFHDLLGNLKVWNREWTWNESEGVVGGLTKNVKGVAWNSSENDIEGSYKPFLMSARSLGVRLAKDGNTQEYLEERFIASMNRFYGECTSVDEEDIFKKNQSIAASFDK